MDYFDSVRIHGGMMYTKEGEFEVSLIGGSPWGFTIRTQSGNGYNRGRVIVAKVVQGGKADISGNIHVGDEIIAVNGFEFDNEEQATGYVRDAKKELILKVKRGQDRRRINIRLADDLPNFYATALDDPYEKNMTFPRNANFDMFANNKRSSKEFEKDLSYNFGNTTVNAVVDYPSGYNELSQSYQTRLTRSTTDLAKYNTHDNKFTNDSFSSSPSWKNFHPPSSPDKVQRVRIRSTNVSSPGQYKHSPETDQSHANSDDRTPKGGYSQKVLEDLNRTWPSSSISDFSKNDVRLEPSGTLSVSAARSHFEQMSQSGSPTSIAPKPPSRTSSFRNASSRLSSSSSVFSDSGATTTTPERKSERQNSFLQSSNYSPYERQYPAGRKPSNSEDAEKPLPPKRFSQSAILNSFRSNKKSGFAARTTSHSVDINGDNDDVFHHTRTQSLPSSKIIALHSSLQSWATNNENTKANAKKDDMFSNVRPERSSSFPRARVLEASSIQTVCREDKELNKNFRNYREEEIKTPSEARVRSLERGEAKAHSYAAKTDVLYNANLSQSGVIQATRMEEVASETKEMDLRGTKSLSIRQSDPGYEKDTKAKPEDPKPKPPKPILKRESSKAEHTKTGRPAELNSKVAVPELKENSLMQRLLMESQTQTGSSVCSTAAAIEAEINKRTDKMKCTGPSNAYFPETLIVEQQPRSANTLAEGDAKESLEPEKLTSRNKDEDDKTENELKGGDYGKLRGEKENLANEKHFSSKVDLCLDKLMVKLESSSDKHRVAEDKNNSLIEDDVFVQTAVKMKEEGIAEKNVTEPVESSIDDTEEEDVNIFESDKSLTMDTSLSAKSSEEYEVASENVNSNCDVLERNIPKANDSFAEDKVDKNVEILCADSVPVSPEDKLSLKIIHSRENSASSLLEETLESARTIASIYSVEGPSRSSDGDDSFTTASEMRRYSLAKRARRRRPKLDSSTFAQETTGESEQSFMSETIHSSFNESDACPHENEAGDDDSGNRSTGSLSSGGSRPDSGIISPKIEALEEQKEILISSMKKKVELLKEQESEINEEMKQNNELGKRVAEEVKAKTGGSEYSKFELFVGELNNIIGLLLSLTQRMHRYEVMLQDIDLAEENGRERRDMLLKRIDQVKQQYEEACRIKDINDKRGDTVSKIVEEFCSDEEFADFQHFVDMKTQLALTQAEIRDKIKLGEEKLNALTSTQIDWTSFDLNTK